jgi:hypothetical protein
VRRDEQLTNAKRALAVLALVTVLGTGGNALRASILETSAPSAAEAADGTTADIPEPASLLLFGTGLLAVARQLRRNRRQASVPVLQPMSAQQLATIDASNATKI